jgi:hypothetical protein
MALPVLTPVSQTNKSVLPSGGDPASVAAELPYGIYAGSTYFLSGAADQVAYTYKKLGGDVLDVEITTGSVYASYEEGCLEYSYQINIHQSKNVLSDLLGMTTGTFDHDGSIISGPSGINLKYPKFSLNLSRRIGEALSSEANAGGYKTLYSASFDMLQGQQDYDLQSIISSSASTDATLEFYNKVGDKKVYIQRVYYRTPQSMWRFYGYYGGLNVVGNMNHYGQFADDSTFEIIPSWHNKLQAMAFEDHLYTRLSHYSFEIYNNKLRLFPTPDNSLVDKMWVQFYVQQDPWEEDADKKTGIDGINNMNSLPFDNLPYENINAIGKHWIRRYTLALSKEILGLNRGKFGSIPIPGDSVTLNSAELLSQAKDEQDSLKEELKTILDEMTYQAVAEKSAATLESNAKVLEEIPLFIYQG